MKNRTTVRRINTVVLGFAAASAAGALTARADLTHRYSFTTDATDSVGTANGTLVNTATVSGGQLQLNNPNFSGPSTAGGYLSLPTSILPSSGSVTLEEWFTFTGSGFFTESFTFSDNANDSNPPGAMNGEYLMHTISAPQNNGGNGNNTGGSHIAQSLAGYAGGETDAFESTPNVGAGGGGYLDDGETFMVAMVIDGNAGTMSYYLYDLSAGNIGGLQQTITAIPLSSYNFSNAYLGRSAFATDNSTSGTIDEFRVYNEARTAAQITADRALGPNQLAGTNTTVSLSVALSGGNAVIKWPTTSALVTLTSSPVLGNGAVWTPVSASLTTNGSGNYQITVPTTGTAQYFRLQ